MLKFSLIQGWVFRLMFCRSGFCKLWSRGHEGNSDWRCKARECAQEGPEGAKGCQTCHQEEMKKKEFTKELSTKVAAIHKSIQEQQHMKCHNTTTTESVWVVDLQRFCLDHQRVCSKQNCLYIDKTLRLTIGPYLAYDLCGCWVAWTLLCS